jgi:hypothetical protein
MQNKKLCVILLLVLIIIPIAIGRIRWRPTKKYMKACNAVDITGDGRIGIGDLGAVADMQGTTDCWRTNNWCKKTDLNYDGKVDDQDVSILKGWYGKECNMLMRHTNKGGRN